MQMHRLKIYSYPYLAEFTDDYINSNFLVEARASYDPDSEKIYFNVSYSLNNDYINKLIFDKKVTVFIKLSCKHFGYVRLFEFPNDKLSCQFEINSLDVEDDVDFEGFIVTREDICIDDDSLSSNWRGEKPVVQKGNVLGESVAYVINVSHYHEGGKQSIVSFNEKIMLENEDHYEVDYSSDRISINMPSSMYKQYKKVCTKNEESIITDFLIPVFASTLDKMKETNGKDNDFNIFYSSREWYRVISNKFEKEFNEDPKTSTIDSIIAAQKLLKVGPRKLPAVSKELGFVIKAREGGIKND